MRDIKFRAYIKNENRIIDVKILDFRDKILKTTLAQSCGEWNYSFDDIELMQYTGLKDKNGKEIYEGDILKINFNIHKIEGYLYLSLTEEEREQRYYLTAVSIPDFYREPLSDDYEVIGNIYENKELLNER